MQVERAREVTGLRQDDDGVEVTLGDGSTRRAAYLIGADGGRSTIRKAAGIDFPGEAATRSNLIAEVQVTEQPPSGMRQDESGVHGLSPLPDGRSYRVVTTERALGAGGEPTLADLSDALVAVFGTDFGVHSPRWLSRFGDATRLAELCRAAALAMPPRYTPHVTKLAAQLDLATADPSRVRPVAELARTLTFRHEMHQEFE